jgi:hypothetical protein
MSADDEGECFDGGPEDDCDHEDYEIDLTGRATCQRCSQYWWPTSEQISAYDAAMYAAYAVPPWWVRFLERGKDFLNRLRARRAPAAVYEDDIPF